MAGYNEKTDSIFICPLGTEGETVEIYGLRITLPKKPKRDEIKKRSTFKKDQYWERTPLPKGLTESTDVRFRDYIDQQYYYKKNGYWFYNDGKPEYITGAHWFLLQWGITNVGYFNYRKAHRDLFYFLEACWVDKRSFGAIFVKTRRTGASYAAAAFLLGKSITTRMSNFGMTSKTLKDAKELFRKTVDMFNGLPFFFKPIHVMSSPKSVLEFRVPSQKTSKRKDFTRMDSDIALNTEISHLATKEDSYDGFALKFYIGDEFSKWRKPEDIMNHWQKLKRVFTDGGRITGKAFILSTVEYVNGADDPYDDNAGTGDKFKSLFADSNVKDRNAVGRTKSGLYSIFISSLDNYGGFIDRYGNCISIKPSEPVKGVDKTDITVGVKEFLEAEAEQFSHNPNSLYNFWRKNPINIEDAFRVSSSSGFLNINNIQDQIDYNENLWESRYVRCNLEWENGVDSTVRLVPSQKGRFKIAITLDKHQRNNVKKKGNYKYPGNDDLGVLGIDPYRISKTAYGGGSKGAIHGMIIPNPYKLTAYKFFLEYVDKPPRVEDFIDDAIKAMVYFGMPALVENNVDNLVREMKERGYRAFSMNRPDKEYRKLSPAEKDFGGVPSSSASIKTAEATAIQSYVRDYVGFGDEDDVKENMPFNFTLKDWIKLDPTKWEKFDASISSSLAIMAAKSKSNFVKKEETTKSFFNRVFKKYNSSGLISK